MRTAAYRLIALGMVFPIILLIIYLAKGAHGNNGLAAFALIFVLPFSLIFLVMGTLRLIQAIELEAKGKKGAPK
jgi:hypothetical protein